MKMQMEEAAEAKLQILLVEDHEIVREGLKSLVNSQADMIVIAEADNGLAAIQKVREVHPAIVVMDVSLPKMNGLQATSEIKRLYPETKVLVFTRHADSGFVQKLFHAGACGYVLKQSASSDLIRAIHIIASGNTYLDPAVTAKIITGYVGRHLPANVAGNNELTDREEEVVKMIAWGYSNKEIAARLDISVKTVEAHKTNAMKKLDFRSRIDIVRYALLQGWLKDE